MASLSEELRNPKTDLAMTCEACPSQWEGFLANGERCYIRYRWGGLTIDVDGKCVFSETLGDSLDGFINLESVIKAVEMEGQ